MHIKEHKSVKKANHKHNWVRNLRYRDKPNWPYCYDLVVVCSICHKEKPAPYKDRLVKVNGRYRYLLTYEELTGYYGEMPVLRDS